MRATWIHHAPVAAGALAARQAPGGQRVSRERERLTSAIEQAVKDLAGRGTTVLLTTQYLDEAEQLADRIAILHEGQIIVNGTLTELKQLLPPAEVEYVEKQPTLEDVFFAIVGANARTATPAMTAASARTSKEQR